ncbi:MAG: fatty acid CoA ligase family protein [Planctomycetaceae bacterium]
MTSSRMNIADRLTHAATRVPHQRAVVFPSGTDAYGRTAYTHLTFAQLEEESNRLAAGLQQLGVQPGMRLVLFVRPSLEFISLTFALFKAGAVIVLIDPGMGLKHVFHCLETVDPDGFVAIPQVHLASLWSRKRFPRARIRVVVGKKRWGLGPTYTDLLNSDPAQFQQPMTTARDPAAIIFTSGSTGPAKGVVYEHGMFSAQVDMLHECYRFQPGEIDLPGFPLFALFNSALGVTTVIPPMDPTRPAHADPKKIIATMRDQGTTTAFGSPALWNRVGRYCETEKIKLPASLKRVISAGAPVPLHVLERMSSALNSAEAAIYTPYGATESLPIASISHHEILSETAALSRLGKGTCVGKPLPLARIMIMQIADGPIDTINNIVELPRDEIGEIIVQGPMVTREYFRNPEATRMSKIADGERFWHRMGDVGYIDDSGRLWFCGRKSHIVETRTARMFTIPCEAIFNNHERVFRCALVGTGGKPDQKPVIVVEPEADAWPSSGQDQQQLRDELLKLGSQHPHTAGIETILFHRSLPVDVRHNVKISRELLATWAEKQLS